MSQVATRQQGFFYGWIVLAMAVLVSSVAYMAYLYGFGPFFAAMLSELGWTRAQLAGGMAVASATYGFLSPIFGMGVDRFGGRLFVIVGNALLGLGLVLLQFTSNVVTFYLFYVMMGLGAAIGTYTAVQPPVVNWFRMRRSFALGLVAVGGGSGLVYGPPVAAILITNYGWRMSFTILGVMVWVLCVALAGFLIRHRPEEKGQLPDGLSPEATRAYEEQLRATAAAGRPSRVYVTPVSWEVGPALRTASFWFLAFSYGINVLVLQAVNTHQVALVAEKLQVSLVVASASLAIVGLASLTGRFVFGALADRVGQQIIYIFCFAMQVVAVLIVTQARDFTLLTVYGILYGAGYGGVIPMFAALLANYFGPRRFATLRGWVMVIASGIFGAIGAPFAGAIYDATKSYDLAFYIFAVLFAVATVLAIFARPPRPKEMMAAPAS